MGRVRPIALHKSKVRLPALLPANPTLDTPTHPGESDLQMKLLPLSDLHLEFLADPFHYLPPEWDDDKETVVLLAGDILLGWDAVDWIERIAPRFKAVCYILGNHEFYHHDFLDLRNDMERIFEEIGQPNIHYLNNSSVIIDDTRVIGSTLWSDFNGLSRVSMQTAKWRMNDFRLIGNGNRILVPEDVANEFAVSKEYLMSELSKPHDGPTVVMTHHLPSFDFIAEEFRHEEELNGAYA